MHIRIDVNGRTCLFFALFLMIVPLKWVIAILLAVSVHEFFHMVVVYLLGSRVTQLRISEHGMSMTTDSMLAWQEFFCAAAGPLGSFLLLFFSHRYPLLAFCGAMQGLYNLLPLYPLDGGRCIYCLCRMLFRNSSPESVFLPFQYACLLALFSGAFYLCFILKSGILPLVICFGLCFRCFSEKLLAKNPRRRYNNATHS